VKQLGTVKAALSAGPRRSTGQRQVELLARNDLGRETSVRLGPIITALLLVLPAFIKRHYAADYSNLQSMPCQAQAYNSYPILSGNLESPPEHAVVLGGGGAWRWQSEPPVLILFRSGPQLINAVSRCLSASWCTTISSEANEALHSPSRAYGKLRRVYGAHRRTRPEGAQLGRRDKVRARADSLRSPNVSRAGLLSQVSDDAQPTCIAP
jgi:hypothetical protein